MTLSRVGRYEIVHELSREPALVYLARDPLLERRVVVRTAATDAEGWDARVAVEARCMAALHHPSIVQVYDFGEHAGVPFIVVELVEDARSLAAYFKGGDTSQLLVLVRVMSTIASALQHAHERGTVHCDVSPYNIIIAPNGVPTLIDFRLAMSTSEGALPDDCPVLSLAAYLAPEAARSRRFSTLSDVWSLGATLFHAIAGVPVWTARSVDEVCATAERINSIDLAPLSGRVPPALEAVIERCLRFAPGERYPSAGDVSRALDAVIGLLESEIGETMAAPLPADGATVLLHVECREPGRPGSYREYEIARRLGSGSFGDVYLARELRANRPLALKILKAEWLDRPEVVQRFQREATLLARLSHENVLRVHNFGRFARSFFIATDLLTGGTLEQALRAEPPPTTSIRLAWCAGMLDGLSAMHEVGVVHRDLKPANVGFVDGRPVIFDLGIARAADEQTLTMAGALLGTPQYMSPEQALGQQCQAESDNYAAGVIAHELFTGELPHTSDSVVGLLRLKADVPARSVRERIAGVPAEVCECIDRMLERDPARRPSAREAAVVFRRALCF